jgi:hypothetical protein
MMLRVFAEFETDLRASTSSSVVLGLAFPISESSVSGQRPLSAGRRASLRSLAAKIEHGGDEAITMSMW